MGEKIIMYESEEAAKKITVTGWVSSTGFFYGDDENIARFAGCTHKLCECGAVTSKNYTHCEKCRTKRRSKVYEAMPYQEWDECTPLVLFDDDRYFFDKDGLLDWCACEDIKVEDLQLVICKPNVIHRIEYNDMYCDDLPEDMGLEDVAPEIAAALDKVNEMIKEHKTPLSWYAGKFRTSIKEPTHDH